MLKRILKVFKRIIFSFLLIYSYNLIAVSINISVPINFITLFYTTVLGIPAFLSIIVLLFIL